MAGLQRSAVSFRRQGSSGIVWDDKFLSGELNQVANQNQEHQQQRELQEKLDINQERDVKPSSSGSITTIERSRSNGGQRAYRTGKVSPAIEPPSPRVSACGFCSAFGKPTKNHRKRAGRFWPSSSDHQTEVDRVNQSCCNYFTQIIITTPNYNPTK
ncbi:MAPK kinase substrate protein At1g80180-like isoform X1 [Manihot esculenta]|uniref:MAPK kinase substrate protein At1g80180-like isoform X1 n=1 Tax=Manihot esculenta TaxID=3983 RepID=UPI001CC8277C|nr:MAPK kinase substrate protein At1g80180-like isoform X1 [Manihot esculenta]XP_043817629.1 MAPK kinase substrate protein At1g80180-like isoform X1 [Manihot esculenta]